MPERKDPRDIGSVIENRHGVDRRKFLSAAAGLASTTILANGSEAGAGRARPATLHRTPAAASLALDGGTPVRATMLVEKLPGPQYYDDDERRELLDVLNNRSPFRWWGSDPKGRPPDKCITFEREFAAHQRTVSQSLRKLQP